MLLLEDVRTPYSHPDSYNPDWRWMAAEQIVNLEDHEIVSILTKLDDEYLMYAVAYKKIEDNEHMTNVFQRLLALGVLKEDPRAFVAEAHRIHRDSQIMASVTGAYIESLLLCFDITDLEVISDRLPVSLGAIEAYEKIFYNCRTPEGAPVKASLRVHFALAGGLSLPPGDEVAYWKYTGAIHGSDLLYNEWGWCMEEEGIPVVSIAKALQQRTLNNARKISETGETPRQATAVMLEVTHRMLEDHAEGELDKDQREVINLISAVRPSMDEVVEDDLLAMEDKLVSRLGELKRSQESKKDQAPDGNAARIMAQLEAQEQEN
jgi:hypothetical protein